VTARRVFRRLGRDTRGTALVLVAITLLPVLIPVVGLGVDTGMWYTIKRQNQSAADAAAISAAYEVIAGNTNVTNKLQPAATESATRNGWINTGTAPAIVYPYSDTFVANGVQVTLHQTQNSAFASLALTSVNIATRAVAAVNILGPSCLTGLAPTGTDITVQGSSIINMPNCVIAADSTSGSAVHIQGGNNSSLTAGTIVTPGNLSLTGSPTLSLQWPAQVGANPVPDPYASTLTHAFLTTGIPAVPPNSNCAAAPTKKATTPYPANSVFCNGLTTPIGGGTVNLSPGTYWVTDGDLAISSNGVLECTACNGTNLGVTIIFTTTKGAAGTIGALTMAANAQLGNLNAPNSGTFAGLLFVQDTVAGAKYTSSGTLQGGPNANFVGTGLVYFPHSNMTFQGNPTLGTSGCLLMVANRVTVAGNSTLSATGCTAAGLSNTPTVKTVSLAE
jgi:Flp pilus assembly protein TadG